MTMNKHLEPAAGALRLRAEEKEVDNCRRNPELLEPLSSETAGRLLHELRVHQIELEMQNEELRVKQAELEVSQARYFNFYNLAPVGYLTISEKGLIEEANLTISTLLGLPEKSLVGRMVSSFIFSEDQDGYYLFIKKLFASTASGACELRLMKPDGEKLWGRMEVALTQDLGGNLVVRAVVSEISAMKKAEEDLHIIAERLELVMEASGAGIWDQDLTTGAVFLDRQWKAIIGYKEDEIKNKSSEWQNRIYPQDALLLQQSISGAQKRKESKYEAEYRLLHKDGTYRWIRTVGKITYDAKHQPSRLTGINVDITDQKNLADLQHESENRLKDFAQAVPDISFVIDEDGRFIEVFGADKALFPVVKKNIRGRTVFEVYPAAMANKLMEDIKRSIEKKSMLRIELVVEVAKGQIFFVGRVSPMNYIFEGKKLVALVLQDFTEHWKAERMLQASYQMRRKSDFLNDLVHGNKTLDSEATDFATKLGLDFSHQLFCCIANCEQSTLPDKKSRVVLADVPARKDVIMAAIGDEEDRIVWDCREAIGVLYVVGEQSTDGKMQSIETAELLKEKICGNDPGLEVQIGIGEVGSGTEGLRKSFQQAWSAMLATRSQAGKSGTISHYRDLGILQLLARAGEHENSMEFVRATIGKIIDYDQEKGTEYLLTLEVILKSDSLKEAAKVLFLHPNTLLFRRHRIEKLLNISLDDFETRVAIIAAVKLHKLSS